MCDCEGILLIVDEIVIGFGCIGKLFVCEYVGIVLDILCFGKVLIGGIMIFLVMFMICQVVEIISNGEVGCFMYGLMFMGNLLVCVVVCVSLMLLESGEWC